MFPPHATALGDAIEWSSPLPKRVETWGESRHTLCYEIVLGRTKLKTNARAPPNDP